jgi:Queuine tRNA-ribosyltransferase
MHILKACPASSTLPNKHARFPTFQTDPPAPERGYGGGHARRGTLNHGVVQTPIFMPVGTYGTVKGVMPHGLHEMGARIIWGNIFYLWMRPGQDIMQQFGGLHQLRACPAHPSPLLPCCWRLLRQPLQNLKRQPQLPKPTQLGCLAKTLR